MRRALIFFMVFCVGMIPRVRRVAHSNLRIAFGPSGRGIYFKSLVRLSENIVAVLKSCRKNPERRPKILFNSDALSAVAVPPPWVFVTGHMGPFELLQPFADALKIRAVVVARPPKNWGFRKLLAFIRRRLGTEVIEKKDVVRGTHEAMKDGKSVTILADHNAGYNGVFVPFLGFAASTTRLPAVLSMRFQKPVIMVFIRKEGPDYLAWVEKVIMPNLAADSEQEEHRILNEMNSVYTDVIRRYPDEWFWLHQRWKTRPGDREAHILR